MEDTKNANKTVFIAIVMFGMYLSFGLSWMGVAPIFPELKKDLSIIQSQATWLISIISLAKSIFPIIAGILATKIGISNTLRISAVLISLGVLIPWLPDYYMWLVGRFLFGVGGAMWVTLMGAVTMQIFEPEKRPLVNSLNGVAVNFGVTLSYWYTLTLSNSFGWKSTLTFYGLISIAFALLFFSIGQIGAKPQVTTTTANNNTEEEKPKEEEFTYLSTLKLPTTWLISFAFTGPLALYLVFNSWLPTYYQETMNIPRLETINYMVLMNAWGIPAAVITGLLVQKFKKCKPFILLAAIVLPIFAYLSVTTTDKAMIPYLLAFTGAGMFIPVSPLTTLLQGQPNMNPRIIGMILGTLFSVTYIVSSMIPGIVGYFYDLKYTLRDLLSICSIIALSPAIALKLSEKK